MLGNRQASSRPHQSHSAAFKNYPLWSGLVLLALLILKLTSQGPSLQDEVQTNVERSIDLNRHPSLQYVPRSTTKVEQIIGDVDKQTKQPTTNQTQSRYGIEGTDLGYSFEHNGYAVFLFGDTIGPNGGDVLGYSDSTDAKAPLGLNFLAGDDGQYAPISPPNLSMFRTHVFGNLRLIKKFVQPMIEKKQGSIMTVASSQVLMAHAAGEGEDNFYGLSREGAYQPAKLAMCSMTTYLAKELRSANIA